MYTAEEKQQIAQLEAMGCYTMSQTTIKEVVGGFMIEHQVTYVHDTEVKGVTRQQMVATDSSAVIRTVHDLYGGPITDNIPASKAEAYVTEDVAARVRGYPNIEAHTAKDVNPKGSMNG